VLGARLFLPSPKSRSVGWLIYAGNDFPAALEQEFMSWNTTLIMLRDPSKATARGLLVYEDTTFGRESSTTLGKFQEKRNADDKFAKLNALPR
jgi:hypothetical protein